MSTSRTQGILVFSSGEVELHAIGQGVSEALFLRLILFEAELIKKIIMITHTDSIAGKLMATRFGTGKKIQRTWN